MRCNQNWRCNQKCPCNRNGFQNGRNFQNQQFGMNQEPQKHPCYNECNVFAASNTTAAIVKGESPTALAFDNILYSYGSAIRAASGGTKIYITQPGLYQVSYFIHTKHGGAAGAADGIANAYLLRNTTKLATAISTTLAVGHSDVLSATEIFYVSCRELPLKLELTASCTASETHYKYLITLNKICTCEGYTNDGPDFDERSISSFGDGFMGCNSNFGEQTGRPGPGIGSGGPGPNIGNGGPGPDIGLDTGFGPGGGWY